MAYIVKMYTERQTDRKTVLVQCFWLPIALKP